MAEIDYSWKQKVLAIIPKFTGTLSFLFSLYIVVHVLKSPKKRKITYHRLLLGVSISDMFGSFFGFMLSTTPFPVGTTFGSVGSLQFTTVAGFFNQAGNASTPLYNGSLATFYLLMIVLGWSEAQIFKIEPILHAVPLVFGWGTAIAGLALKLYAPANWISWIAQYPAGCKDSFTYGYTDCIRGDNAWIYRWAFLYAEVWFTIVYVTVIMCIIYTKVLRTEQATDQFSDQAQQRRQRHRSKRVANQAMAYVGAFLLTWVFGTLTRLLQLTQEKTYFPIIVCMTIFFPLQGFFNAIIYLRPRFLRYRKANPSMPYCKFLFMAVMTTCHVPKGTRLSGSRKKNAPDEEGLGRADETQDSDVIEPRRASGFRRLRASIKMLHKGHSQGDPQSQDTISRTVDFAEPPSTGQERSLVT